MFLKLCFSHLYLYRIVSLQIWYNHIILRESGLFSQTHSYLRRCPKSYKNCWEKKKKVEAGRKNAVCVCQYLQEVRAFTCVLECHRTHSVHFFGSALWVFVCSDISKSDVLLLCSLLVTRFPFDMEANHQLINDHTDDGTKERSKNGHEEPALSSPEELQRRDYYMYNLFWFFPNKIRDKQLEKLIFKLTWKHQCPTQPWQWRDVVQGLWQGWQRSRSWSP